VSRFRFIEVHGQLMPVRHLYQVLGVVPSRYYARYKRLVMRIPTLMPSWKAAMVQVFAQHKRRSGIRRLRVELQAQGYRVGHQRLRTALRHRGLRAL
jgi:putative transposase